jgi:N-glycosylase/DNA lyase
MHKTLDCGQCFRWHRDTVKGVYIGVVAQSLLVFRERTSKLCIYGQDLSDEAIEVYFDLKRDYQGILDDLAQKDQHLAEAVEYGKGIHILKQAPFETLISFIISSNNNIPKIKMTVEALCESFGKPIAEYDGKVYYAFPTVEDLADISIEGLNVKAIGYRAKSVWNTVQKLLEEKVDLVAVSEMDYGDAKVFLKTFYGVGDKVADCVLLFGYGKFEAFPIDVWVMKVLVELYNVEKKQEVFVAHYFGAYPGIAQQYLFYYMRDRKNVAQLSGEGG